MSLARIAVGPVGLKGLGVGEFRPLSHLELDLLRKVAAGIAVPSPAFPDRRPRQPRPMGVAAESRRRSRSDLPPSRRPAANRPPVVDGGQGPSAPARPQRAGRSAAGPRAAIASKGPRELPAQATKRLVGATKSTTPDESPPQNLGPQAGRRSRTSKPHVSSVPTQREPRGRRIVGLEPENTPPPEGTRAPRRPPARKRSPRSAMGIKRTPRKPTDSGGDS
jgi:hypothetical protein